MLFLGSFASPFLLHPKGWRQHLASCRCACARFPYWCNLWTHNAQWRGIAASGIFRRVNVYLSCPDGSDIGTQTCKLMDQKPKWSWPGWALFAYRSDLPSFASALGLLVVKTRVRTFKSYLSPSLSISQWNLVIRNSFPLFQVFGYNSDPCSRRSGIGLLTCTCGVHCLCALGSQGLRSCLRL